MKPSQSCIARIERGQVHPSTAVPERLAKATGTRLSITFEPVRKLKRGAAAIVRAERNAR